MPLDLLRPPDDIPATLDQTLLRPDATKADILAFCEDVPRFGFGVVFVHPCVLDLAMSALAGVPVRFGVPIGFPFGTETTTTKVHEAVGAVELGAVELDMVLHIGWMKSGDYARVRDDIAQVVQATPGVGHKVILETCYLTKEEKVLACALAVEAGVDYVKTSTGFGSAGATVEDVQLIKETLAGKAKIKASGGIRTLAATCALLEAGADRIGTSQGVAIVEAWRKLEK